MKEPRTYVKWNARTLISSNRTSVNNLSAVNWNMEDKTHWISYVLHPGTSAKNYCSRCFGICVVLDDNARYNFSGIRLRIISREPAEGLRSLNLKNCPDLRRHLQDNADAESSSATYRCCLARQQHREQSLSSLPATHAVAAELPLCTITFEVSPSGNWKQWNALHLIYDSSQFYGASRTPQTIYTIYDRVHTTNPSNPSLCVFLDGTRYSAFRDTRIPIYSVRVLPTSRRSRPCDALPLEILQRIVEFAIGMERGEACRPILLVHGLVCRSWSRVLDHYCNWFRSEYRYQPGVLETCRLIEAVPKRGALIRTFSGGGFCTPSEWPAFVRVLRYAESLSNLTLHCIDGSVRTEVVSTLAGLRNVHTCTLKNMERTVDIDDIQTFIADWKQLETLFVSDFGRPSDFAYVYIPFTSQHSSRKLVHPYRDASQHRVDYLKCNVKDLTLRFGGINDAHLLRFIPTTSSNLRNLKLQGVVGISNRAFKTFLASAAHSLRSLELEASPMPRDTPDEEFAIDALMPMLKKLECLRLSRESYCTVLALTRKPALTAPERRDGVYSSIVLGHLSAAAVSLQQVAEAMEVTGWESVTISWTRGAVLDDLALDRANCIARRRGIALSYVFL
ncbi:hypothetical protein H0H81_002684 [Sphagnurus paluster]|uniref:F-box domain-containing protein n=1 Tax=Sphagnurus paluster TaxID=117069 RepID=A0A9P7FX35_9AGAR|nr:hypothetical protein H0H81_002684 [Sphagnurus paluster]